MQEWIQDNGYRVKTIRLGDATVYVRRPILSSDEYGQRERSVRIALEVYGRTVR